MFQAASARGAATLAAVALAALCVSCGTPSDADQPETRVPATTTVDAGAGAATPPEVTPTTAPGTLEPVAVRDAFAGLQATLDDTCTPGNCAYFLGRVYDELMRLDRAMKADPKGPGHFPEPIALISELNAELDGDRTFENLKEHQTLLIGTRDEINTWMQDHPDDYR
ncbi:hypothetical protein JJV70_06155 [Streptomyces sp. JJ66]|uniref:hypothetical protein n=1 Tax=Streptomyces sp. JJ66 TaxID=2803843 RepID=UPI001C59EDE5|nr:hypothetical protein [Streptomyces sp. JJ66]MBW1601701.1 hypothetical protein [Streptomyces sp. JJ66]